MNPNADRARTHIKALAEVIKPHAVEGDDSPGHFFITGVFGGLALAIKILDGATAEEALDQMDTHLAAAVGRAFLNGNLPAPPQDRPTV